jgi:16S rRNA (guanine966-N2)-methyltransferase
MLPAVARLVRVAGSARVQHHAREEGMVNQSRTFPGKVRIIAGDWRGRTLPVPDRPGLRPTGARIRETLFNWLAWSLPGAHVLDPFAGTGILAFEALSRGAASATLIETDDRLVRALRDTARLLDAHASIINADAAAWLARGPDGDPFDIVFLDPPFDDGDIAGLCTLLHRHGWLREGAAVYLEQPHDRDVEPGAPFRLEKEKQAGQVRFAIYRYMPAEGGE